eukprot:7115709-Karenia_brevis.AAC.1
MASGKSCVLDVARAAALAAHTAASLTSQVRRNGGGGFELEALSEAAKILRSCEALARSAVALL